MADECLNCGGETFQPTTTNLAPGANAELTSTKVVNLRKQRLQSAVTVADILRCGQTVDRGTLKNLQRLRGNSEKLERARIVLPRMNTSDSTDTSTKTGTVEIS